MVHIDASLMRVVVDQSFASEDLFADPSSSLYYNLHGRYRRDAFDWSAENISSQFRAATVIAHEQRHYVDYMLTNYGSWLARFWSQFRQFVPALASYDGILPIPLRCWQDEMWKEQLNLVPPEDENIHRAVSGAVNRSAVLNRDRVPELEKFAWLTGNAQLEALATTFEVGPIETHLKPESWFVVKQQIPRDMNLWNRQYIWPAQIFDSMGFGGGLVRIEDTDSFGADTRLWPTLLVASLMGRFTDLMSYTSGMPSIWDDVLPSRRFMRLVVWLRDHYNGKLKTPEDAWEAVNEGCVDLFSSTVVEALEAELASMESKLPSIEAPPPSSKHYLTLPLLELITHVRERRRIAQIFIENPMKFLDPHRYWNESVAHVNQVIPEYFLVNRRGFDTMLFGHERFSSEPYLADIEGRPIFLKPSVQSDQVKNMEFEEELTTCIARYYLDGCLSSSWIGPELSILRQMVQKRQRVIEIPPYGMTS